MTTTDYLAIAGLLAAFVGLPGGLIGMSLRGLRKEIDGIGKRMQEVEQGKVSHAEWVRVTVSHNNRMDRVSEQLAELSGKMDATFGIPVGLTRIAAALEQHTEPKQ